MEISQQEDIPLSKCTMNKLLRYEKAQLKEQRETNFILWVNTIFTVLTGVAVLALTVYQIFFK